MTDLTGAQPAAHDTAVAREIARADWSATPVGAREEWPPLLDALVRVLLASEFPMWLGWGPDLAFFYNDAYRRVTLGVKHPWALGRPAREVWAEIWDDLAPRVDRVLSGESTWDEALLLFLERSGYPEETYHTFSYSPVTDAEGTVHGLLCVVNEETDRVIGDRRLSTLRHLAADLATTRSEEDVYAAVSAQLRANAHDLPYTLTYLFDGPARARLVCATGAVPGSPIAPVVITADGHAATPSWPVDQVWSEAKTLTLDGVRERFADVPRGAWAEPSDTAILVPLAQQGQAAPAGFLVAGWNPYRPQDPGFSSFVELLAGQVAAGISSARAYESERRRAEALAELDRAKTEFFSNVSHEFRTPLTLILGPAEDALDDDLHPLDPAQAARLDAVRRNARRLRRLVNDMLDFARIEGGRLRAETQPLDLAQLTRDLAMSFAPAIERAGLTLTVECPRLDRVVHVDPDMWEKILLNLLSNALKFTLDGGIAVNLADRGDAVELSVSDTGVGIPAEHLPHLFERFYRAPRSDARSHEGTGIGLALTSELVQLHGGTIAGESAVGHGSTFTVRVPYGDAPTATGTARAESALDAYLDEALQWLGDSEDQAAAETGARPGRPGEATVLVVDDNPDMRRYVARILEPFWEVLTAPDGTAALELVREAPVDLVLSDVMMPRTDGFALLRALRANPSTATVPVVFLSARAGEEAAIEGLESGADDYLVKPFSAIELVARVRSNLELAAMRTQEAAWRTAMIEALDEGVIVLDAAFSAIEVNPAFERILGFPRTATPFHPPFPWAPDEREHPEDRRRFDTVVDKVIEEGKFRGVVTCRHRDGQTVFVDATVRSLVVAGERRYIASLRDVTAERASAERASALAQLGVRLAEASSVDAVVAAGVAELERVFGAARVGVELPEPLLDGWARSADPDPRVADALAAARTGAMVAVAAAAETGPAAELHAGLAAPLDPGGGGGTVWLEFSAPRRVSADDRSLFAVLCGYFGQALHRAQLFDASQAVATAMQRSILGPTDVPAGVAVRYAPAVEPLEVGGDWYDAVELPGGRVGLVVGDCVGRGLPAATVMGQLRSACRALLLQAGRPGEVVAALDAFADRIPGAACTTVFCGIVDLARHTMEYCNAGHLPGVVIGPGGDVQWLHQPGSVPLAVVPDRPREEAIVSLEPGSSVLVCTDGLVERRGERLDDGLDRLVQALRSGAALTPGALADHLMREVLPPGGQEDDVAMVIYRDPVADAPSLSLEVRADAEELAGVRRRLGVWLSAMGATAVEVAEIVVAVAEAVANAMEHGYGFDGSRTVAVTATLVGRRAEVEVRDTGGWKAPAAPREERGRGMRIMRGLMDRVTLSAGEDGTAVVLVRAVGHAR